MTTTLPAQPAGPAATTPSGSEPVLYGQKSKKRGTVGIPHIRLDQEGNIYLSKPAVEALELSDGAKLRVGHRPGDNKNWFVMPVSATDDDAFVLKLKRGQARGKEGVAAKDRGEDVTQEYGGNFSCKELAMDFYKALEREPSSMAWRIVTTPEAIESAGHPFHKRCFPILTVAPLK